MANNPRPDEEVIVWESGNPNQARPAKEVVMTCKKTIPQQVHRYRNNYFSKPQMSEVKNAVSMGLKALGTWSMLTACNVVSVLTATQYLPTMLAWPLILEANLFRFHKVRSEFRVKGEIK